MLLFTKKITYKICLAKLYHQKVLLEATSKLSSNVYRLASKLNKYGIRLLSNKPRDSDSF